MERTVCTWTSAVCEIRLPVSRSCCSKCLSLSYLTTTSYLDELSGLSLSLVLLDNEGESFDE